MAKNLMLWVLIAFIAGGFIGYMGGRQKSVTVPTATTQVSGISQKGTMLQSAMRKLWEDHITWTRLYIVEVVEGSKGVNDTAARLLKNQEDLGRAIKPFYGEEAGNKLTALLKEHIMGAVDVLAAAKAGDNKKVEAASAKWYKNGEEITIFLNGANPQNWPLQETKDGMKMHLDLTLAEAVAQLQGKYSESIQDYDKVHEHILGLADMLSKGIMTQFPDKF